MNDTGHGADLVAPAHHAEPPLPVSTLRLAHWIPASPIPVSPHPRNPRIPASSIPAPRAHTVDSRPMPTFEGLLVF